MMTIEKEKVISDAKHCIGMNGKHKPYHRNGKAFYRPWRNRFNTNVDDPAWSALTAEGYAEHGKMYEHPEYGVTTTFFWLTRAGLDWIGGELGVHIYDESD